MRYGDVIYGSSIGIVLQLLEKINTELDIHENDNLLIVASYLDEILPNFVLANSGNAVDPFLTDALAMLTMPDNQVELKKLGEMFFVRLLIILKFAAMLESDQSVDLEKAVDFPVESFTFAVDVDAPLPFNAFGYVNSMSLIDSIAYFNFESGEWFSELAESKFNNQLLSCALFVIAKNEDIDTSKRQILVRDDAFILSASAALRLQAVSHGRTIHCPVGSSLQPSLNAVGLISAKNSYQQFNETLLILSEFNARSDILNKYLSIYHVIEGFMYKIPLVDLGRNSNGDMFSIRDFKRLYSTFDVNETVAIKNICTLLWGVKIGNIPFSKIVENAIKNVKTLPGYSAPAMDKFLAKLQIFEENGAVQLSNGCNAAKYSLLIYKVRCAIVHNSETELHISHFNLSQTLIYLIDEILMKPLESLVLKLISDKNSQVWYAGPSLNLY